LPRDRERATRELLLSQAADPPGATVPDISISVGWDHNVALRARIVALAQRHRRYCSPMLYLKLRQAGELINHKRVERLYGLEKLNIKRRRRKKIAVADRQPSLMEAAGSESSPSAPPSIGCLTGQ